jgi:predicted dehydrogenase
LTKLGLVLSPSPLKAAVTQKIALDCIERNIHVIIEKPIALSLADADAIIDAAERKGVAVSACHQNRFNISIQDIRKALEAGRFGKLSHGAVHVRWNRTRDYYTQAPWRGTWENDGGALMNQGIHGIDLLRWMMGSDIDEVFAYTSKRFHTYIECEDIGLAVIKFKNGALGSIEVTTNVFPRNLEETLYLFGENGTVKAGVTSMNTLDVWKFADERPEDKNFADGFFEETANVYGNGHARLYKDVINATETGCAPYVDAIAGRNALELVLAVYKSSKDGRPIKLPLLDCRVKDFIKGFDLKNIK